MHPIAVILPVYNGGEYLKLSVESVLGQGFGEFEFYILDDYSTDESWSYLTSIQDKRVKLFRNEKNKGLFYNLNFLINHSAEPLIKLWSQDDIMYPECLEKTVAFHRKHPDIGFSYSERHYIDGDGAIIPVQVTDRTPEIVSTTLHSRIAFYTGSIAGNIANVTLSRDALNRVGLFREDMKISGDFDMWVRLARDHAVGFLKEPLIQLRDHKNQLSRQEKYYVFHLKEDLQVYHYLLSYVSANERIEGRRLLRDYKLLFYYTLMAKSLIKGRFRTFSHFYGLLSRFDNMGLLTVSFLRQRIFQRNRYNSPFRDNAVIIEKNT
ncbi:glycosyltransferase [Paraflavitalea soli]|uniref:Glycosyltransferase n=1 Tax=Paraflavitalea soli TaxID=2315862 RepID=A0A3B7N4S5_9BACT|nr:glycosyltransferase [Paraflavitalea soli]AXY77111.1 glycosyltransferase [Paraflavitalea soli]